MRVWERRGGRRGKSVGEEGRRRGRKVWEGEVGELCVKRKEGIW